MKGFYNMTKAIATISKTNEILKQFSLYAKKNYGQNFIIDPSIVEKIANNASFTQEDAVIEIGPGIGALTEQLAKRAKAVYAFEIDERLLEVLTYSLKDYTNVTIIHQDFLLLDLKSFVDSLKENYRNIVVCANLPYYITTPILFKIFESKCNIPFITVMMQKEVADRFTASVNSESYNALSVMVQYLYDVKVVMKIPRTIFNPKPNVDSTVIQFIAKEIQHPVKDQQRFFDFIKACFKQRRKTLYNNLRAYLQGDVEAYLTRCNLDVKIRGQQLTLQQFIELYEVIYEG